MYVCVTESELEYYAIILCVYRGWPVWPFSLQVEAHRHRQPLDLAHQVLNELVAVRCFFTGITPQPALSMTHMVCPVQAVWLIKPQTYPSISQPHRWQGWFYFLSFFVIILVLLMFRFVTQESPKQGRVLNASFRNRHKLKLCCYIFIDVIKSD